MPRWAWPIFQHLVCFLLAGASLIQTHAALASDTSTQQQVIARIQQAIAKTNIFELPSFTIRAAIQADYRGKPLDGSYELLWNGPDQWKEEFRFPGYAEVQVGGKGTIWVQRSTNYIPFPVFHVLNALGFGSSAGLPPQTLIPPLDPAGKIKKTFDRAELEEKLDCAQIVGDRKSPRDICISSRTGAVVRVSSFVDSDFQPAGSKILPRSLTYVEAGKLLAAVTITDFITPAQFPEKAFVPPSGVSAQPGCMNPTPFTLDNRRPPEYPTSARMNRVEGTVAADVRIGDDGLPTVGQVVDTADPDLEKSALRTMKAWHYEPARCNGEPVEAETVQEIHFKLVR